MYLICWMYCGKSRNESEGCILHEERERKSTVLLRQISKTWNFPRVLSCRVVSFQKWQSNVHLEHVEDPGVVDGDVLPPQFLELVAARTGDCRVRRCAAALLPPARRSLRLSPLRLSGWYCSVDRRTERTHAAELTRPVFDVFNGFPPIDPDVKL